MSSALSAAGDSVKPPRMAIPPLLREMREEMQKEVDGETILQEIEAMAEEAVAQAMKKRKLVY